MGNDNALPPSKKRAAGREISKDNPGLDDEDDVSEQELGTFKKASDEVLAARRIVKVRRQPASSTPSAPTSNPFAGIRLVPPVSTPAAVETKSELPAVAEKVAGVENKEYEASKETGEEHKIDEQELEEKTDEAADESSVDKEKGDSVQKPAEEGNSVGNNEDGEGLVKEAETTADDKRSLETKNKETNDHGPADGEDKTEGDIAVNGDKKEDDEKKDVDKSDAAADATPFSSFQQLSSSKNAFTGFAGTGGFSSSFSFGSISTDGSLSGSGFGFGSKTDQPSPPPFSFGTTNNGSTPLFSATAVSGNKTEGATFPAMQEVPVETGEENEKTVFTAESALFEFSEGGWKERGKGEVKLNVSNTGAQKARLVMRARGNYRLILNANLYPDMKLAKMDKKGVTFPCLNSATEEKTGLATIALKFKDASFVETFCTAVAAHKGEAAAPASKTPENSPKDAQE